MFVSQDLCFAFPLPFRNVPGQECGSMWQAHLSSKDMQTQDQLVQMLTHTRREPVQLVGPSVLGWLGTTDGGRGFSVQAKECLSFLGGTFIGALCFQVRRLAEWLQVFQLQNQQSQYLNPVLLTESL